MIRLMHAAHRAYGRTGIRAILFLLSSAIPCMGHDINCEELPSNKNRYTAIELNGMEPLLARWGESLFLNTYDGPRKSSKSMKAFINNADFLLEGAINTNISYLGINIPRAKDRIKFVICDTLTHGQAHAESRASTVRVKDLKLLCPDEFQELDGAASGAVIGFASDTILTGLDSYRDTFVHEVHHACCILWLGGAYDHIPAWFGEGLARVVANQVDRDTEAFLQRDLWARTGGNGVGQPNLNEITSRFPGDSPHAELSKDDMAWGMYIVKYISDTYGSKTIREILSDYALQGDFMAALEGRTTSKTRLLDAAREMFLGVLSDSRNKTEPQFLDWINRMQVNNALDGLLGAPTSTFRVLPGGERSYADIIGLRLVINEWRSSGQYGKIVTLLRSTESEWFSDDFSGWTLLWRLAEAEAKSGDLASAVCSYKLLLAQSPDQKSADTAIKELQQIPSTPSPL